MDPQKPISKTEAERMRILADIEGDFPDIYDALQGLPADCTVSIFKSVAIQTPTGFPIAARTSLRSVTLAPGGEPISVDAILAGVIGRLLDRLADLEGKRGNGSTLGMILVQTVSSMQSRTNPKSDIGKQIRENGWYEQEDAEQEGDDNEDS